MSGSEGKTILNPKQSVQRPLEAIKVNSFGACGHPNGQELLQIDQSKAGGSAIKMETNE